MRHVGQDLVLWRASSLIWLKKPARVPLADLPPLDPASASATVVAGGQELNLGFAGCGLQRPSWMILYLFLFLRTFVLFH
jgi:hypothetical protein